MNRLFLLFGLVTVASPVTQAAERTITLSVPTMNCPVCPITVKKALSSVQGVGNISVDLQTREVRVTFDDEQTDVYTLIRATTNAGYPSTPAGTET